MNWREMKWKKKRDDATLLFDFVVVAVLNVAKLLWQKGTTGVHSENWCTCALCGKQVRWKRSIGRRWSVVKLRSASVNSNVFFVRFLNKISNAIHMHCVYLLVDQKHSCNRIFILGACLYFYRFHLLLLRNDLRISASYKSETINSSVWISS